MKNNAALLGGMCTATRGYYPQKRVNGQGVDVLPVLENNWRTAVLEKLATYKTLSHNWNSYGSPPPSHFAIKTAASFLMLMSDEDVPRPRVTPVSGGGILFEWKNGERAIDLEFLPDGTLEYLWIPDGVSEGSEVSLKSISEREIDYLMSWIKGF